MRTPRSALFLLGLSLAGCSGHELLDPSTSQGIPMGAAAGGVSVPPITVLTQNLYPGANLDLVFAALATPDPTDDAPALGLAIQTLQETDFPARAALLADEIARVRPHAVALQEVSIFHIAAAIAGQDIDLDFLPILEAALAERGLHYVTAGAATNYTVAPLAGISYGQGDALLIDADRVEIHAAAHHIYTYNLGEIAPGITLRQGWSEADASIGGRDVIFISTHPEADLAGNSMAELRAAQVTELVSSLPAGVPVVVMGDLNDEPGSLMYQVLTGAGLTDVWRALRPGVTGNTCCHDDNLGDMPARLDQHIDYIFARGFGMGHGGLQGRIALFGDQPSERIAGPLHPLWSSDHAGLVATLNQLPPLASR
jgi:endonuclease/exonuclease/phosphatase family metal-dependent hydrolase